AMRFECRDAVHGACKGRLLDQNWRHAILGLHFAGRLERSREHFSFFRASSALSNERKKQHANTCALAGKEKKIRLSSAQTFADRETHAGRMSKTRSHE